MKRREVTFISLHPSFAKAVTLFKEAEITYLQVSSKSAKNSATNVCKYLFYPQFIISDELETIYVPNEKK